MSIYWMKTADLYPDGGWCEDNVRKRANSFSAREDTAEFKGTMYGKGAFRALMAYLERELPQRDFKGIFLEQVHNEHLQSAALRSG